MQTVTRDRETGRFERTYSCDSCQMLSINGRPCHETGCPADRLAELEKEFEEYRSEAWGR